MTDVSIDNYKKIFLEDRPLIDLRAPIEFAQGAFPNAVNLPLMSDEERALVGTCYKQKGPDAALELGYKLVNGSIKAERQEAWSSYLAKHKNAHIYCFRGGQRSRISQAWIKEIGFDVAYINGGYKALRTFLIEQLDLHQFENINILGGKTGSGKTIMLRSLKNAVDLEGAANHRGSAFGRHASPCATQISFENKVAIDLLKVEEQGFSNLTLEDESRAIGPVHLPKEMYERMRVAPLVVVDDPLDIRLERLLDDYVTATLNSYISLYGEDQGWELYTNYLQASLTSVRKRLGLERYAKLQQEVTNAIVSHKSGADRSAHLAWLEPVLVEYYDPMYTYQLAKHEERIVYKGDYASVYQYLEQSKMR